MIMAEGELRPAVLFEAAERGLPVVRADRERGDSADSPTLFGGVLGWSLPGVKLVRTTLAPGDCVVMATDGVAADFGSSLVPGASAQEQAERVLASAPTGTDLLRRFAETLNERAAARPAR